MRLLVEAVLREKLSVWVLPAALWVTVLLLSSSRSDSWLPRGLWPGLKNAFRDGQ